MSSDSTDRSRAVEGVDRSMVVEASAGTGKTRTLTSRIRHLVLVRGPGGAPLPLSRICAITFTEKAAGEMKVRLREMFEAESRNENEVGERARQALADLETAAISTFHAFAVSLLKERPIEAGLDPRFKAMDEFRSELLFREVWDSWIQRALAGREPVLERALRGGIRLDQLRDLADTLRLHAHAVRSLELVAPMTEEEQRRRIEPMLSAGRQWQSEIGEPGDKLATALERVLSWLEDPRGDPPKLSGAGRSGSAKNWDGGAETVEAVRGYIKEVAAFLEEQKEIPGQTVLDSVVRWMRDGFLSEWENRKRAEGLLDFEDQLVMARDLLAQSRAARREFQNRYAALLVDEFQDTDPLQLEIVLLLTDTNLDENDRARMEPSPGRLFIVGDPKQSIYRFRRADIETYQSVKSREIELLHLTKNFRSVPGILRFVDRAFGTAMTAPQDGSYQPDYLPFGKQGAREGEPGAASVFLLDQRAADGSLAGSGGNFFEAESRRIAALIEAMRTGDRWLIEDAEWAAGRRRPRHGDIAVLLPVLTRADVLEDALRDSGIPYVLEGGRFYYARSEVSSAITVLAALANPNDRVAVYGALRSIFFGLSDEDLFRALASGSSLDYRQEAGPDSILCRPFELLRRLHAGRHGRPPSETLEMLLLETGAREVLAARGRQSVANLGKLIRTVRSLQDDQTFSQVVGTLRTIDEEEMAESESRIMEERSDAVRVLSIHRAKGLDFPVVIVAGLGFQRRASGGNLLADVHRSGTFAVRAAGIRSPGWKDLADREKSLEDAELVRLLYVAMTRARDYLVVCAHHKGKPDGDSGEWSACTGRTRLQPIASVLGDPGILTDGSATRLDPVELVPRPQPASAAQPPKAADLRRQLQGEYRELDELLTRTPVSKLWLPASRGAHDSQDDHPPEERTLDAARSRAVRIGVAFHEAMEQVRFDQPEKGLRMVADEAGRRHQLDAEGIRLVETMLRKTLASPLIERARAAERAGRAVLREMPYIRHLESREGGEEIEEGKIDLLFEEAGGWVLVDYKTDEPPRDEDPATFLPARYAAQMRRYAEAVTALGLEIGAGYLLSARTGAASRVVPE